MSGANRGRAAVWAAGLWGLAAGAGWAGVQVYIVEADRADSPPELVLVEKEARESSKDGAVVLVEPGGLTQKVAKERILARLSPAPAPGQTADRATAVAAINALLEAKAKAAALERTLQEEVEKWKRILDQLPPDLNPTTPPPTPEAWEAARNRAMPNPYQPAKSYTREELDIQLGALEQLQRDFPARQEEIEEWKGIWKLERAEMASGKKKLEGRWLTPEEWREERGNRERAAREAFLAKLEIPEVSPVLVGQGIFLTAAGVALGGAFLGFSFLFHGILEFIRHRAWWKGIAWCLTGGILLAVLAHGTGLLLASPDPLPDAGQGDAEVVEEVFWRCGGQKQALSGELRISDADLNAWFSKRLRFSPIRVTDIAVLVAEGWRLNLEDRTLRLDRTGRFFGRTFVLRHEMTLNRSEGDKDFYCVEATLGKLRLPPALALRSWNQWIESLARMTAALGETRPPVLERIEKGALVFSAPSTGRPGD